MRTTPEECNHSTFMGVCPLSPSGQLAQTEANWDEAEAVLTHTSYQETNIIREFLTYLSLSALFILIGLLIGIIGYHCTAHLSWVDATVEASMILSGMGPISSLSSTSAKIFASIYALFSGLIFVLAMGVVLSPLLYSLLRQLQVNKKEEEL